MAKTVNGTITAWSDGSRRFRTTDVTVNDVSIRDDAGETLNFPKLEMQLKVARLLFNGARGRFYLSSGKRLDAYLFGVKLSDGGQAFDGNDGFDTWMVAIFYLVVGVAFAWTIIGIFVALVGWRLIRQMKDAKAAKALYDADA
jgi:hypothetical protein